MANYFINEDLYPKEIESYTTNTEFEKNYRVHTTNEATPIDLLLLLPRPMRVNPMWQWLVGDISTAYQVEFNTLSNGKINYTKEGYIDVPSIAKFVNGVRSFNYGDRPERKINPETGEVYYTVPVGRFTTLDGVLAPEVDLLIHEVYRYLNTAYPNHPGQTELLTLNEQNDEFESAGEIINYKIDTAFMDNLARDLDYDESFTPDERQTAIEYELFKLKYRNLTNHSFRRKLLGSPAGYWMLGAEIFRKVQAYPMGQYLPLECEPVDLNSIPEDRRWIVGIEEKPENYTTRRVNKLNKKYLDKFRLLDLNKNQYDYSTPPIEVEEATCYSVPHNCNKIYEFRYTSGERNLSNIDNKFYEGMAIEINDKKDITYINSIESFDVIKPRVHLEYENDILKDLTVYKDKIRDIGRKLSITRSVEPIYTDIYVYDKVEKLIEDSYTLLEKKDDFTQQMAKVTKKDLVISKATISPFDEGFLMIPFDEEIKAYTDGILLHNKNIQKYKLPKIFPFTPGSLCSIKEPWTKDVLAGGIISYIEKGSFEISFTTHELFTEDLPKVLQINKQSLPTTCLVLDIDSNKVMINGKANIQTEGPNNNNKYNITNIDFEIQGIKEIKSIEMMELIYNEKDFNENSFWALVNKKILILQEHYLDITILDVDDSFRLCETYTLKINKLKELLSSSLENIQKGIENNKIFSVKSLFEYLSVIQDSIKEIKKIIESKLFLNNRILDHIEVTQSNFEKDLYFKDIEKYKTLKNIYFIEINKDLEYIIKKFKSLVAIDTTSHNSESDLITNTILRYRENKKYIINDNLLSMKIYQTLVDSIYSAELVKEYDTFLKYKKVFDVKGKVFGIKPLMVSFIQTSSLGHDINPTCYSAEGRGFKKFIDVYEKEDYGNKYQYKNLNPDLLSIQGFNHVEHKLSSLFFDLKNNIKGWEIPTYRTDALVSIDFGINDRSGGLKDYKVLSSLSLGDRLSGEGVSFDTYITEINLELKTFKVNKPFLKSGDFKISFFLKLNSNSLKETTLFDYKKELESLSILDLGTPSSHGLYGTKEWPKASLSIIPSSICSDLWYKNLITDLTEYSSYRSTFNTVVNNLYKRKLDKVLPSHINFIKNIFLEINVDSVNSSNQLMSVEILDYISSYSKQMSKASDSINIGPQLTVETDLTTKFSQIPDAEYTDPNINLKAKAYNWNLAYSVPSYLQLGSGDLTEKYKDFWTIKSKIIKDRKNQPKSYWDHDIWASTDNTHFEEELVYFSKDFILEIEPRKDVVIKDVYSPLLEILLGEHEVLGDYRLNNKKYTIINASVYKQCFENIVTDSYDLFKISSKEFIHNNILVYIEDFKDKYGDLTFLTKEDKIKLEFLGDYEFSIKNNQLQYPSIQTNPLILQYYAITKSIDHQNIVFRLGDIISFKNDKWVRNEFIFGGFIGSNTQFIKKLIQTPKTRKPQSFSFLGNSIPMNQDKVKAYLKHILYIKLIFESEVFNYSLNQLRNLELKQIEDIFLYLSGQITEIDADIKQNIKNNKNTLVFNLNNIYWFMYAESDIYWEDFGKNFNPGDLIALYNNKLFLLNKECYLYYLISTKPFFSHKIESLTFLGLNGETPNKILPVELIKKYNNLLALPKSRLVPGLTNIKYCYRPEIFSNVIDEDGSKSLINITQLPVYLDYDNKELYTYSKTGKKYIIDQLKHKYWKNIANIQGYYQIKKELINGNVVEVPYIYPIENTRFDVDYLNGLDRILDIQEVGLRSEYSPSLEATAFSLYANINGFVRGLNVSKNLNDKYSIDGHIIMGAENIKGLPGTLKTLEFCQQLEKIRPLNFYGDDLESSDLIIPEIKSLKVYSKLTEDQKVQHIKYFKNLLVLEGYINTLNPNIISFEKNSLVQDALKYITLNDSIEDICLLNPSIYTAFTPFASELKDIKRYDWKQNIWIGFTDYRSIYYCKLEKLADTHKTWEQKYLVNDVELIKNSRLESVSYDRFTNTWYLLYSLIERGYDIYLITFEDKYGQITPKIKIFANAPSTEINTYQAIDILDNENRSKVFLRDIAFSSIMLQSLKDIQLTKNDFDSSLVQINGGLNRIKTPENFNIISNEMLFNESDSYQEIDLGLQGLKLNNDSNLQVSITPPGKDFSHYKYNINSLKWEKVETKDDSIVLNEFNGLEKKDLKTYIMSKDMLKTGSIPKIKKSYPIPPQKGLPINEVCQPIVAPSEYEDITQNIYQPVYKITDNGLSSEQLNNKINFNIADLLNICNGFENIIADYYHFNNKSELKDKYINSEKYPDLPVSSFLEEIIDLFDFKESNAPINQKDLKPPMFDFNFKIIQKPSPNSSKEEKERYNKAIADEGSRFEQYFNKYSQRLYSYYRRVYEYKNYLSNYFQNYEKKDYFGFSYDGKIYKLKSENQKNIKNFYSFIITLTISDKLKNTSNITERIYTSWMYYNLFKNILVDTYSEEIKKYLVIGKDLQNIKFLELFKSQSSNLSYTPLQLIFLILGQKDTSMFNIKISPISKTISDLSKIEYYFKNSKENNIQKLLKAEADFVEEMAVSTLEELMRKYELILMNRRKLNERIEKNNFIIAQYDNMIDNMRESLIRTPSIFYYEKSKIEAFLMTPETWRKGEIGTNNSYLFELNKLKKKESVFYDNVIYLTELTRGTQSSFAGLTYSIRRLDQLIQNIKKYSDNFLDKLSIAQPLNPLLSSHINHISNIGSYLLSLYLFLKKNVLLSPDNIKDVINISLYLINTELNKPFLSQKLVESIYDVQKNYFFKNNEKVTYSNSPRRAPLGANSYKDIGDCFDSNGFLDKTEYNSFVIPWPKGIEIPPGKKAVITSLKNKVSLHTFLIEGIYQNYCEEDGSEITIKDEGYYIHWYMQTPEYKKYVEEYNKYLNSDEITLYLSNLYRHWGFLPDDSLIAKIPKDQDLDTFWIEVLRKIGYKSKLDLKDSVDFSGVFGNLPINQINKNTQISAIVFNDSLYNKYNISFKGHGQFAIDLPIIKTPPVIGKDQIKLIKQPNNKYFLKPLYNEGVFFPYLLSKLEQELAQLTGLVPENIKKYMQVRKFAASSPNGQQAVIIGDYLFVKTYIKTLNDSNEYGSLSKEYHWKMIKLPDLKELGSLLLEEMGVVELGKYADNLVKEVLALEAPETAPQNLKDYYTYLKEWLSDKDNRPLTFNSLQEVPQDLRLNGVRFELSVKGKIPKFLKNNFEIYSLVLLKDSFDKLVSDNYYSYLYDYITYVLGLPRFEKYIDNNILSLSMSDNKIKIYTETSDILTIDLRDCYTRTDMENIDNWNLSHIDDRYIINAEDNENILEREAYFMNNKGENVLFKVPQNIVPLPKKAFVINQKYELDNLIILLGYIKKPLYLNKLTAENSEYNKTYPNDGIEYIDAKYPWVSYSINGGKSFEDISLPTDNTIVQLIDNYSDKDLELINISRIGSEIQIWLLENNKEDESGNLIQTKNLILNKSFSFSIKGYFTLEVVPNGPKLNVVPAESITPSPTLKTKEDVKPGFNPKELTYTNLKNTPKRFIEHEEYNKLLVFNNSMFSHNQADLIYTMMDGSGMLVGSKGFNLKKAKINLVSASSIEINSSEMPLRFNEDILVLVAINTIENIQNPIKYLRPRLSYFDDLGNLRIKDIVFVEDKERANRMYLRTELTPVSSRKNSYLPLISQDIDKKIFKYHHTAKDKTGKSISRYICNKNKYDENIILCNQKGCYLSVLDLTDWNNFYTAKNLIENNINPNILFKLPILLENPVILKEIEFLSNILKESKLSNILFKKGKIILDIQKLIDQDFLKNIEDNIYDFEEYQKNILGEYLTEENPFSKEQRELNVLSSYTADLVLNLLPLKDLVFNLVLRVPYNYQDKIKKSKFKFKYENNSLNKIKDSYITSIYLPSKGYGSSRTVDSFDLIHPWDIDGEAFENITIRNNADISDYIYLSNEEGEDFYLRNGFFDYQKPVIVDYLNLIKNKNKYKIIKDEDIFEYNIYKLPDPEYIIWSLTNQVFSNIIDVRLFKDGLEQSLQDSKYTIYTYQDTKEISHRIIDNHTIELTEIPTKDIITLYILDEFNNKVTADYVIGENFNIIIDEEPGFIKAFDKYVHQDISKIKILYNDKNGEELYNRLDKLSDTTISSNGNTFYCNVDKDNQDSRIITFKLLNYSNKGLNKVEIIPDKLYLNIPFLLSPALSILTDSDYIYNNKKPEIKIYSGNTEYIFDKEENDNKVQVKYKDTVILEKDLILTDKNSISSISSYILYKDKATLTVSNKGSIIDGLYGRVILKKPRYESFQNLIQKNKYIINKSNIHSNKIAERDRKGLKFKYSDKYLQNGVNKILPNHLYFILDQPLDNPAYNDLLKHSISLNLLPTQSIELPIDKMNDKNYIYEIKDNRDLDLFGFDRIWFNKEAYPVPPLKINNTIHYIENKLYYQKNKYKNKQNTLVYMCNEDGLYCQPTITDAGIILNPLGDDQGDCSKHIYGNIDKRYIPLKPLYLNSFDWYVDKFHIDNKESNPFWQYCNIKDTINYNTNSIDTIIEDSILVKQNTDYIIQSIPDKERYYKIIKLIKYSYKNGNMLSEQLNYIDHNKGGTNLIIIENVETDTIINKYGIQGIFKGGAGTECLNTINYSYTCNSLENVLNKYDTEAGIANITELGIFDQYHNLIAYANFPPIQYRTDTQHFSTTFFVSHTPLIPGMAKESN